MHLYCSGSRAARVASLRAPCGAARLRAGGAAAAQGGGGGCRFGCRSPGGPAPAGSFPLRTKLPARGMWASRYLAALEIRDCDAWGLSAPPAPPAPPSPPTAAPPRAARPRSGEGRKCERSVEWSRAPSRGASRAAASRPARTCTTACAAADAASASRCSATASDSTSRTWARAPPSAPRVAPSAPRGGLRVPALQWRSTRRVHLVRGEGRDLSG